MFIKKDLRKVDEIFADKNDLREYLILSKRQAEFQTSIKILCRESNIPHLQNLKVLNLYDNSLSSLQGIGMLSQSPLEELNLGSNKLTTLPLEFGALAQLNSLWLEDNEFENFPIVVCQLTSLISLRLSGNSLQTIPISISSLSSLETLAVDNNELKNFPEGFLRMQSLKHLWIRQNKLEFLPDTLDALQKLQTLSVSSNMLTYLPDCIVNMSTLQKVYANGNKINSVHPDLCTLPNLETLNLANNKIEYIPMDWEDKWGKYNIQTGTLVKNEESKVKVVVTVTVTVTLLGNNIMA